MFSRFVWQGRFVVTALLVVTGLAAVRCTMSPNEASLRLQVDTDALKKRLAGTKLANLSCFFVSVSGPGVTYDYSALDLQDRKPECMGLNRTSNLATLDDLKARGVKVRTAAGPQRLIRIMGASTSVKDCTDRPIKDLFDKKVPYIYEVARTEVDLYVDKRVDITTTNDLDQAKDIVAPCDNTGGIGGGTGNPGNIVPSGALLALTWSTNGPTPTGYTKIYDISNSAIPVETSYDVFAHPSLTFRFFVQPNARSFYLFSAGDSRATFAKRFTVGDGVSTAPPTNQFTVGGTGNYMTFSPDSKYAYVSSASRFYQWVTNEDGLFSEQLKGFCEASGEVLAANATHMFEFNSGGAMSRSLRPDGNLCPNDIPGSSSGSFVGSPVRAVVGSNGVLYVVATVGGLPPTSALTAYTPDASGNWPSTPYSALSIPTSAPTDLAIDPQSRFLFVASQASPSGVSVYKLDADGKINAAVLPSATIGAISNLTVDPLGRAFYAIQAQNQLMGYAYDDQGSISPLNLTSLLAASVDFQTAVLALPILK